MIKKKQISLTCIMQYKIKDHSLNKHLIFEIRELDKKCNLNFSQQAYLGLQIVQLMIINIQNMQKMEDNPMYFLMYYHNTILLMVKNK